MTFESTPLTGSSVMLVNCETKDTYELPIHTSQVNLHSKAQSAALE